jgi:hypothetical protein
MAAKKSYKKPEAKKIILAPQECCAAGCKTFSGTDKAGRMCRKSGNCNNSNASGS